MAAIGRLARALSTKVRVRQHVNPLARRFEAPIDLPDWPSLFPPASSQVHLDIGCARGGYLFALAAEHPTQCFLGVEIREPLVLEAVSRVHEEKIGNVHVLHANMNLHIDAILSSLRPTHAISSVSIFHPDPWMKKRHLKRRLVNPAFVQALATHLAPATPVFLQTDVLDLFEYMVEVFAEHPHLFTQEPGPHETNAMGIPTDRETYVVDHGGDIYRTAFRAN
ncbi:tRNA (guanine-N(7)-)-methyltransferase [Saprolegnia parasitica CBS 223.65]|uniref:tRNA (guanine(46)-N(7))-methyltransferase n=1 Tax=Saprolegnia parasitica (strain CBS 223.65) TaxID=695850 RepID=A0A067CSA5_SAPPC|nr:tRNA (guanine-N(7)-)-methyltransferase [Saprolegnia parasitica CBS 223.65]KDO33393.1 tRNA (guanine-N(7)-)-methyltransferase [Saprolegnia parasitica CBS 223.65]|eukprot:XP_012196141.1 tRNA (guanine-N(7)-)-methyltransferase [Saprolegnia parasitica CBS 223.65]